MSEKITEVMSANPITLQKQDSVVQAARIMRDNNVGSVLVSDGERLCGVVTDRDLTIRVMAQGGNVSEFTLDDVCSHEITTLTTTDSVDDAVKLMRSKAIRRLPVVEGGHAVGIVSLGDLALDRDPSSVLGAVSSAPPNL